MATKPKRLKRRNRKPRAVKKSLSLSPNAWKALEVMAGRWARASGMPPNYSTAASQLICVGAGSIFPNWNGKN